MTLTLRKLYVFMALVAVVSTGIWVVGDSDWINSWMPNIATEALGALVTVAVVDFILQRQRRPLASQAAKRISVGLARPIQAALTHRQFIQPDLSRESHVDSSLSEWLDLIEGGQVPERRWLTNWSVYLKAGTSVLDAARERYDRVLSDEFLAALDDFLLWATHAGPDLRWTVTLDNAANPQYPSKTWQPRVLRHFEHAVLRTNRLLDVYQREFGQRFTLSDAAWQEVVEDADLYRLGLLPEVES